MAMPSSQSSWKNAILACGSNAFSQLNFDAYDLMSSTLKPVSFSNATANTTSSNTGNNTSKKGNNLSAPSLSSSNSSNKSSHNNFIFNQVSCGSNVTAMLVSNQHSESSATQTNSCYIWGEGFPGSSSQFRVPTSIATSISIKQISCGQSHAGFVTEEGRVYTWGNGENGMLGHGNKQNLSSPKPIVSMQNLVAQYISCGAFHTAIIAASFGDVSYLKIPWEDHRSSSIDVASEVPSDPATLSPPQSSPGGHDVIDRFRQKEINENILTCGDLYTCGLGKAGQLGLGMGSEAKSQRESQVSGVAVPTLVQQLKNDGYRVARVSCGFHHTLLVATPIHAVRTQTTSVFSFGWGDFGRLVSDFLECVVVF